MSTPYREVPGPDKLDYPEGNPDLPHDEEKAHQSGENIEQQGAGSS